MQYSENIGRHRDAVPVSAQAPASGPRGKLGSFGVVAVVFLLFVLVSLVPYAIF